jgi:hypothetical protein
VRSRGWLDLIVNQKLEFLRRSSTRFEPQHPKGYFQPGVLAVTAAGRVLYRWRGVPSRKNMGGATERPTAAHVASKVLAALDAPPETPDTALDAEPPLDSSGIPWPLFAALLIANGWFVAAMGFGAVPGGPTAKQRVVYAMLRLVGFVGLWGAALVWLPTLPVLVALGVWAAFITPKVRFVNDQFQNVPTS